MTEILTGSNRLETAEPHDFSIVVPCFNEAASIHEFNNRLIAVLKTLDYRFEIVYVNDGSTDGTLACLHEIRGNHPFPVCVVDLVQNVGQTNALTAGLQYAVGRHIIFMDCDLQVAPEDLPRLLDVFDDTYDMVGGARSQRRDNLFRVCLSRAGNALVRSTLGLPLRDFGSGMKVVNGAFVRAFEPGPFRPMNPGAMMLCLRRVAEVPIAHHARTSGHSRWTLWRFFALYHNIFRHVIPFIYPFTVVPLLVMSGILAVYFAAATLNPSIFPYADRQALVPMLMMTNIALNFVTFLLLGEFVMRGGNRVQEPAYIVRKVYRALKSKQPEQ